MTEHGGWTPEPGASSVSTGDPTSQLDVRGRVDTQGGGSVDHGVPGLPGEGGRAALELVPEHRETTSGRVPVEARRGDDDRSVLYSDPYGSHPLRHLYAIIDGNDRAREVERAFIRGGLYLLAIETLLGLLGYLIWLYHA